MKKENLSCENVSSSKFGYVLEKNWIKFGKITNYLFSSSSPMTTADKVGLAVTILAFSIILSPIALSDADPYHLKGFLEEIRNNIYLIEGLVENQDDTKYKVIAHLKLSPESHLDTTEKVILGKFRTLTN